jgi:hypothetical protein
VTSDLRLSAADQHNVQAAIRTILVWAAYDSLNEWRVAIHRAVKRVVDGDMVFSYSGAGQFDGVLSEEIGRIGEFPGRISPLARKFSLFERSEELGVWDRQTLHQDHYKDFLRSSYYHEFARPLRALDGVGIAVQVRDFHAGLQLHRDSERGAAFGNRGVALLQLLFPVFQVAIDTATSHFGTADQLDRATPTVNRMACIPSSSASSNAVRRRPPLTHREL